MNRVLLVVVQVFALALLCDGLSGREGDECTSGFMSLDRMDVLLDNDGRVVTGDNYQRIFPEVGFTCSGSILGWVFGADWGGQSLLPELQIWRPVGGGAYTKVGNTSIMTKQGSTQFYEYNISSSPLAFQAGDVLGYYQPRPFQSQLRLMFEEDGRGRQNGYYYFGLSSASDLLLAWGGRSERYQLLVNVVTDSPGCVSGFMSVERMRLLLNIDSPSSLTYTERRQQISPEMRFTCDGMITKWIIGADWSSQFGDSLYPELQVWRNVANDTYRKISGTFFFAINMQPNRIYEYSGFSPIPVKSGDILGIFLPQDSVSRLRLRSERTSSPTQYYHYTGDSVISPYDVIDIESSPPVVITTSYRPFVSVEFVRSSTSSVVIPSSTSLVSTATSRLGSLPSSAAPRPSPEPPSVSQSSSSAVAAGVGAGVGVVLGLVIVALVVVILVLLVLRRRQGGKTLVQVEQPEKNSSSPVDNPVYTAEVSGAALTRPLGELYEVPQQDEAEAVYDAPEESNGAHRGASRAQRPPTSPVSYAKFDNLLYETN